MATQQQTLELLKQAAGLSEAYTLIATVQGYRDDRLGSDREITIQVWDAGEGSHERYHVVARDEDGRVATGNPMDSLELAIRFTHWDDLEKGEPERAGDG